MTIKEANAQLRDLSVPATIRHSNSWQGKFVARFGEEVLHSDTVEEALKDAGHMFNQARRSEFNRLMAEAQKEENHEAEFALVNGQTNADDTLKHDERDPRYWDIALNSIQGSIESNCQEAALFPWFKAHGFAI